MTNFDDVVAVVGMILGGLFVLWILAVVGVMARTKSACLDLGYPAGNIDYRLRAYCVVRVDQTDVVVPLAEATRR